MRRALARLVQGAFGADALTHRPALERRDDRTLNRRHQAGGAGSSITMTSITMTQNR